MNEEMIQPEIHLPTPIGSGEANAHRRWVVTIVIATIILVSAVVWLGNWAINERSRGTPLTTAEKQAILDSLRRSPDAPALTAAEKQKIIQSLQTLVNAPKLTDAQKAEILKSLK